MPACPAFDPLGPYVTGLTRLVDCHARALGEEGYRALGYGSPIALALTGLLVIYVALVGYRMLLGDMLSLRESVVGAVRIGFVLALASQWPAYQTLVYNVVIDGPGEIAARVLAPGGLGGGDPNLIDRIQAAYTAIERAARPEPVTPPAAGGAPAPVPATPPGATQQPATPAPITPTLGDSGVNPTISRAGQVMLVATLAGVLSVRIVAGLMLALGPIAIACLLFGALRGVFEGWVRVLAGAALGAIGVAAVLAFELAIVEPQVGALLAARTAADPVPAPLLPGQLFATTALFALVLLAMLLATTRMAAGFRLPDTLLRAARDWIARAGTGTPPVLALPAPRADADPRDERPRALAIADAISARVRQEQRGGSGAPASVGRGVASAGALDGQAGIAASAPLGQSYRRTASQRRSASAGRRDAAG
ncbi:MAG: type IV secretion system protein [Sphingomonas sp.]|uniref:type IV secretion system protein n=1 Tax=Sphingomonas sp. TaxID=28214 RepID=UPI0025ED67D7|nr:type IV secretion system protein [Sphingomonas sp.]MBX9881326.1 type IV secretion system protein [Sphingomonas sp.]